LLADDFSGPLHRDKHKAEDHAHRQTERHFAADAQRHSPHRVGHGFGKVNARRYAGRQNKNQHHANAPRNTGTAEQRCVQRQPRQAEHHQYKGGNEVDG